MTPVELACILGTSAGYARVIRWRIRKSGSLSHLCPQCRRPTVIQHDGERFCTSCGFSETSVSDSVSNLVGARDATDPRSFDSGLGSEPLQTIQSVKFHSHLLRNTWQVVAGNAQKGQGDSFVESCLRDLFNALDGASDEQVSQCRAFMLQQIRDLRRFAEVWKSRKAARKFVVARTVDEAARTWPRIGRLLRERGLLNGDGT